MSNENTREFNRNGKRITQREEKMADSMIIVIDKSFLQAEPTDKIQKLCHEHRVLLIPTLLAELIMAGEGIRTTCFRKLSQTANFVIENVGGLMRYEVIYRRPCQPVGDRLTLEPFPFSFHTLADGNYPSQLQFAIESWKTDIEKDIENKVEDHKEASALVTGWFPELANYSPGDESRIKELMKEVSEDDDLIRYRYNQIKTLESPEGEIISKEWALFRWTQANLLYAIEYIRKYGPNPNVTSEKLENEILDIDYCITGSLAGCLASKDKKIREIFRIMCPNGHLLPAQLP